MICEAHIERPDPSCEECYPPLTVEGLLTKLLQVKQRAGERELQFSRLLESLRRMTSRYQCTCSSSLEVINVSCVRCQLDEIVKRVK